MSGHQEVTYTLDFCARNSGKITVLSDARGEVADSRIPRLARLLALAIRLEGLIREEATRDYAELARLGRVTRARMTQIMNLLHLAPDIQEAILGSIAEFVGRIALERGPGARPYEPTKTQKQNLSMMEKPEARCPAVP